MANRPKFKIRDLHREVALVMGFHHRNISEAHNLLQNLCIGATYADMVEAITNDKKWSDSHDRTFARIYLAACRMVEMMGDKSLDPNIRGPLVRELEEWMGARALELRRQFNLADVTRRELERNGLLPLRASQRPSQKPVAAKILSSSSDVPPPAEGQ